MAFNGLFQLQLFYDPMTEVFDAEIRMYAMYF